MSMNGVMLAFGLALCATAQGDGSVSKDKPADSSVRPAKAQAVAGAAAPPVVLIDGEMVRPDEAMTFTRSVLIEDGPAVAAMAELQENINAARHNFNSYRIGYSLPSAKVDERFVFNGPIKGWRATSTGDVSVWPPKEYPASRLETMRRTKLLQPIVLAESVDEMNNLRLYSFSSLSGHDGREYRIEPMAMAFFIHPKTGYRMTVASRAGRVYGSVNKPLATTSNIFVQEVITYPAGPLGIGKARAPSVFFSKTVRFDMEPFAAGNNFERLMDPAQASQTRGPLPVGEFRDLFNEMLRYTGGAID